MEIRLRYSTIINYASLIFRLFVSVSFVVIIARRLKVEEFGLWGIIFSLTTMLMAFPVFWNKWVPRFYVRGFREAIGTSFILTLIFSIVASLLYIALSYAEFLDFLAECMHVDRKEIISLAISLLALLILAPDESYRLFSRVLERIRRGKIYKG